MIKVQIKTLEQLVNTLIKSKKNIMFFLIKNLKSIKRELI